MLRFKKLGIMTAFLGLMLAFGTSAQAQVLGGNGSPEVTIYVEKNSDGPLFDTFKLFATAEDVGQIRWMKVYIDGQYIAAVKSDEYTMYFEADGVHVMRVIARDDDGNLGIDEVTFSKN